MTQAERRQQLRRRRRGETLRQLWRFTVFSGVALGLGYALLRYGWVLRSPEQIEVVGSRQVHREQIVQVADLRFPVPLLTLRPHQLASALSEALPVDQVQVQRLMAPPRLKIELVDRRAIARAERRGPQGPEQGFVDHRGNWMSLRQQAGVSSAGVVPAGAEPGVGLVVKGWQPRHRAVLAMVFSRRPALGEQLLAVRFEPGGSLWIDTRALGAVRFGPTDDRLSRRLDVLEHLLRQLPAQLKGRTIQSIDLSDPDQPEIALPGSAGPRGPAPVNP